MPPRSFVRHAVPLTLGASLAFAGACVPKGKYDQAVADLDAARRDLAQSQQDAANRAAADRARLDQLNQALQIASDQMQVRDAKLSDESVRGHDLQTRLDEATAINQQVRSELEHLGKNVDKLLSEKGVLSKALEDAKARLEELRKAQAAADARAALFQQLLDKLKKLIDSGELSIVMRDGRMVIRLPDDVLFDSGRVDVKPVGQLALAQVAAALKTLSGRKFQVAGHTDDVPIQTARFPSNWELSTQRAIEVVRILVARGIDAKALSAAGYGEFDPIAPNDATGRAKNRRTEISLVPNLDEIVSIPEARPAPKPAPAAAPKP